MSMVVEARVRYGCVQCGHRQHAAHACARCGYDGTLDLRDPGVRALFREIAAQDRQRQDDRVRLTAALVLAPLVLAMMVLIPDGLFSMEVFGVTFLITGALVFGAAEAIASRRARPRFPWLDDR